MRTNWAMLRSMAGKDRLSWINTRWALFDRIWPVAVAAIGGGVLTWLTDFMGAYAPASYGFGAGLAALMWLAGSLLVDASKTRRLKNKQYESLREPKSEFDPLASTFEKKRIWVEDLFLPGYPVVEDKTFLDCEFVGPANIMLVGDGHLTGVTLSNCDLILITPPETPHNAKFFKSCLIKGGGIFFCTLYCNEHTYRMLRKEMTGDANWLSATPHKLPNWPELSQRPANQKDEKS